MPFVIQHGDGTFHGRRRLTQYQKNVPSRQPDLQKATVWKRECDAQYSFNADLGDRIVAVQLALVE